MSFCMTGGQNNDHPPLAHPPPDRLAARGVAGLARGGVMNLYRRNKRTGARGNSPIISEGIVHRAWSHVDGSISVLLSGSHISPDDPEHEISFSRSEAAALIGKLAIALIGGVK